MAVYGVILGFIWLAFIAVWIIGMFTAKRTRHRNWLGGIGWRIAIVTSIILLVHYHLIDTQDHLSGVVQNPVLGFVGVVLAALGVALAIWARFYLGRNWGMPLSVKENPELVVSGPYAHIRHPIYTGILLAFLGSALIDWWWAIIFLWSAAYFVYASHGEEKLMQKEFPDAYPAYKARTWRLVPFIY